MPYIIPNLSYMWPYFSTILGPYQEGKPEWDGWISFHLAISHLTRRHNVRESDRRSGSGRSVSPSDVKHLDLQPPS